MLYFKETLYWPSCGRCNIEKCTHPFVGGCCVCCGKQINREDPGSHKIDPDSIPIYCYKEAEKIMAKYDSIRKVGMI